MSTRITVDGTLCQGHGRCYTVNAPDIFSPDDEGFTVPRDKVIDVPDELVPTVEDAVSGCPERAIRFVET